jgi:hypothetical protein
MKKRWHEKITRHFYAISLTAYYICRYGLRGAERIVEEKLRKEKERMRAIQGRACIRMRRMKYLCARDGIELTVLKNEVTVIVTEGEPPVPKEIWYADLCKCPKCKLKTLAGFGLAPIATADQADFLQILGQEKFSARMIVYNHRGEVKAAKAA